MAASSKKTVLLKVLRFVRLMSIQNRKKNLILRSASHIELVLRSLFLFAMSSFLVLLQIEFYRQYDSTEYPVLLAIACEVSLVSLALTKFRSKILEFLRSLTFVGLFFYVVGSLSYDVYSDQREGFDGLYSGMESDAANAGQLLRRDLEELKSKEKIALSKGAWKLAKNYQQQVIDKGVEIQAAKKSKKLGFTDSQVLLILIALTVFLRAALTISNALNAAKLRELVSD